MSDFNSLRRHYYQQNAYSPDWGRAAEVIHSDIVLHLPVLEYFASQCRHVTEFGVRDGHSTVALAAGLGRQLGCMGSLISYDIEETNFVRKFRDMAKPCYWGFRQADTGDSGLVISPTDLLFIDTLHTYDHVTKELTLHGRKATKYLAFHDTFTCGEYDRSGPDPGAKGILPAVDEFLAKYPGEYRTAYRTDANNGLLVLERIPS